MSIEHQKVMAASTAALMSISSSVPEIQLQPAILKQYVVWIAAPAAALEHPHPKCKKKTSTQWLTVEDCSRIGLSRGHGWQQPSKACSSRAHSLNMEEGGACKKIETVCGTIIIQLWVYWCLLLLLLNFTETRKSILGYVINLLPPNHSRNHSLCLLLCSESFAFFHGIRV
jgi:hypothetical protein